MSLANEILGQWLIKHEKIKLCTLPINSKKNVGVLKNLSHCNISIIAQVHCCTTQPRNPWNVASCWSKAS